MASSGSEPAPPGAARPVIGLTAYQEPARMLVWECDFALLHQAYVGAVERAGGIAVLLPPQASGAEDLVERLDGVVLSGGADVDPARYGRRADPRSGVPRVLRDEWELELIGAALRHDVPLLAVCRGMQLLNAALGGSLHQHLPDVVAHEGHQPAPGVYGDITVRLTTGSRLAELLGEEVSVRCHHHQAVDRLAAELTVSGCAPDGTIEAVELAGPSFALGVQWHPEAGSGDDRLFAALVAAAGERGTEKRRGVR